jgi:hypothetical protein
MNSLMVPGVQDPDGPDRLDHLLEAHGYLAAPVQHGGEPPAELEVPAPFGLNWPGPAVAAELSVGVDARPEAPLASLGHVTKGELCREQALVFLVQSDHAAKPQAGHPRPTSANSALSTHGLLGVLPPRTQQIP